jgi:hypothetical protein
MKRTAAVTLASTALSLLLAACGGTPPSPSGVATMPSPSAGSAAQASGSAAQASGSASPAASGEMAQALAYARCLRANGVPDWPDPDSHGVFDKSLVVRAAPNRTPQLDAAFNACESLLPTSMQGPTPAQVQQAWSDDRSFVACMRSLGVTNAPDPVSDDNGMPVFNLAGTGIDPKSPQILAKAQQCQTQLHMSGLPQVTGGSGS